MVKALIDADVLVGLIHQDDANHQKARAIIKKHLNASIYITPYTIPETATVLSHKVSQRIAISFLHYAENQIWTELTTTETIIQQTHAFFCQQTKKGTSWVDCLNCIIIKTHRLDGIFSFDRFYRRQHIPIIM